MTIKNRKSFLGEQKRPAQKALKKLKQSSKQNRMKGNKCP
jgi:hypothetical protein